MARRNILTAGNRRTHSFWNNDMSLTSRRGSMLLSNRKVAQKLAVTARVLKESSNDSTKSNSFVITDKSLIKQLQELKK